MNDSIKLFLTFLKIGAITFGGGYAMIPIISEEMKKFNQVSDQDIKDLVVISEMTPGVFSINAATYIGYKVLKVKGSILATLGVIIPSIIIISLIYYLLYQYKDLEIVAGAFKGVKCGIGILILYSVFKLSHGTKFTLINILLIVSTLLISLFTNFSIIYIFLGVILLSVIFAIIKRKKEEKKLEQQDNNLDDKL
jgi:chromate transporter